MLRPIPVVLALLFAAPATASSVLVVGDDAAVVTEVRTALGEVPHKEPLSAAKSKRAIDKTAPLVSCQPVGLACQLERAAHAGVDELVDVRVLADGSVQLVLVGLTGRAELATVTGPRAEIGGLVSRLLDPSASGSLRLVVEPAGTTVQVDGVAVGESPFARPVRALVPGEHAVTAELAEHVPESTTIEVKAGEEATAELRLVPVPPPPSSAPEPSPEPERPAVAAIRVAVYDFELHEVDPRIARVVTDSVLDELRKLQRISVIGMEEVRAMLDHEAQRQMAGCEADESCLADIAGALGADVLVLGNLSRLNDEHIISLKRVDQYSAKVNGSVTKRLEAGTGEEYLVVIGDAVEELFPADEFPLREDATRGVSEELVLRLNPPPFSPWVFWTGVGVSGALLATSGGLFAVSALLTSDYNAFITQSAVQGAELKRRADTIHTTSIVALSALGAAAIAAGLTAGSAAFVDWQGVGEEAGE